VLPLPRGFHSRVRTRAGVAPLRISELPRGVAAHPRHRSAATFYPGELGAHKAGTPALCNDKLGLRFVKANWISRLLAYPRAARLRRRARRANSRAHARLIDPDVAAGVVALSGDAPPLEIRHVEGGRGGGDEPDADRAL